MKTSWLLILCFFCGAVQAQDLGALNYSNILGVSGYGFVPHAYVTPDRNLIFGAQLVGPESAAYLLSRRNDAGETYLFANLNFLPFLEVTGRLSVPNAPDRERGIGDRSVSGKIQLLKEGKNYPAVAFGLNDLGSRSDYNRYYHAIYIVISKSLELTEEIRIHASAGYGDEVFEARNFILQGFFGAGGVNWKNLLVFAEYDAEKLNFGARMMFWKKRFSLNVDLIDAKYPSIGAMVVFKI